MNVVEIDRLTRTYRGTTALDGVTAEVREGTITGLLGRNGAGKSTLLRILSGWELPSSGEVRVLGEVPFENRGVLGRMVSVRETSSCADLRLSQVLEAGSLFHPRWDAAFAASLVSDFELPLRRRVKTFSRGMTTAVGIVLGLASRAEVTIFDEPYAGLDAVARRLFYDRMLADYAEHPRTIVISTHLIDEISDLLDDVIVLDHGRVALAGTVEDVTSRGARISGREADVQRVVAGLRVLERRVLAGRATVAVAERPGPQAAALARERGVTIEALPLQELVVTMLGGGADAAQPGGEPGGELAGDHAGAHTGDHAGASGERDARYAVEHSTPTTKDGS